MVRHGEVDLVDAAAAAPLTADLVNVAAAAGPLYAMQVFLVEVLRAARGWEKLLAFSYLPHYLARDKFLFISSFLGG